MKKLYYGLLVCTALLLPGGCTDLMEEPYDQIVSDNFYQKKEDIIRSLVRSFEHGFWSAASDPYVLQELTADQFAVLQRGRHWYDDGVYFQLHHHEWTFEHWVFNNTWNALFNGVALANNSLEDLQGLDYTGFGMTAEDQQYHVAELRTLRAWYYLRAFDIFRNIPIATTLKTSERYLPQSTPRETFDFIERELLESVNGLPKKGDKANLDGMFTQAAAMTALARLYLNAEVYIGQPMYEECAKICQDIIDGLYGDYSLDEEWRGPFDYNNHLSPEMIFAFPSTKNRSPHHFNLLWWSFPNTINEYFQYFDQGLSNPRFCLNPSLDPGGNEYAH
ncbi:MAG TPA: RagB/SusD family nutrient uptake outer membrane protein, partial [Anseongella sp.]|nr:RagB/SusD family nutrient uptake outer membrane protein [Anseongella sp.]